MSGANLVIVSASGQLDVEKARTLLAKCVAEGDFRGLTGIRAIAGASEKLLRQVKAGREAQNSATEIVIRSERALGEILKEQEKAKGGGDTKTTGTRRVPVLEAPTLADQNITKKESALWQTLAKVPEQQFEEHVQAVRGKAERLTTSSVVRLVKPKKAAAPKRSVKAESSAPTPDQNAFLTLQDMIARATSRSAGEAAYEAVRHAAENGEIGSAEAEELSAAYALKIREIASTMSAPKARESSVMAVAHGVEAHGDWDEDTALDDVMTLMERVVQEWQGPSYRRLVDRLSMWTNRLKRMEDERAAKTG